MKNPSAKSIGRAGKVEVGARRSLVIDPEMVTELDEAAKMVGADNAAVLTRQALRHVFARIKAGELVNLNGKLTEISQINEGASHKAA